MTNRAALHADLLDAPVYQSGLHDPDDERLARWFGDNQALVEGGIALIGFPCDIGVARNGGRPGAASAPNAVRRELARLTPPQEAGDAFRSLLARSVDLGDIRSANEPDKDDLAVMQDRLGRVVTSVMRAGGFPIVLGGGHETAYGHYLGFREVHSGATVLNWDAHPDVRPLIQGRGHSGSPFRQILDLDPIEYLVAGLQPWSVAKSHLSFVSSRGRAWFRKELVDDDSIAKVFDTLAGPTMLSLDIDAVDGSQAPGVSASSTAGFSSGEWLHVAENAGRCPSICSADLVEVNPRFDVDGRTVRLAAITIWHLIRGLSQRTTNDPATAAV